MKLWLVSAFWLSSCGSGPTINIDDDVPWPREDIEAVVWAVDAGRVEPERVSMSVRMSDDPCGLNAVGCIRGSTIELNWDFVDDCLAKTAFPHEVEHLMWAYMGDLTMGAPQCKATKGGCHTEEFILAATQAQIRAAKALPETCGTQVVLSIGGMP